MRNRWQTLAFRSDIDPRLWELFHENSKQSRLSGDSSSPQVPDDASVSFESLCFNGFPVITLPSSLPPLRMPVDDAMRVRVSVREMVPYALGLEHLGILLHYGYGIHRHKNAPGTHHSRRLVPSAGALYPLEIYVYAANVKSLPQAVYHYHPVHHHLRLLREGNHTEAVMQGLVPNMLSRHASLIIFITAMFQRSTEKYGDRGYRFALLEAGHAAQNINLAVSALKLGCLNIGGFYDREMDTLLQLDGVAQSTLYIVAVGMPSHSRMVKEPAKRKV